MDSNIERIEYEIENNIQWIATSEYNFSFQEFTQSTDDVKYLASAFLKNYERAGVEVEERRRQNAENWWNYFGGVTPTLYKKSRFNWTIYANKLRNKFKVN